MGIKDAWIWKSLKEKGIKATWKQFKYNFKLYDPIDAATDQIIANALFIVGWIFAIIHSIFNKNYWLIIMGVGGILLFQSYLRQNIKQKKVLKRAKEEEERYLEELEDEGE